ncbi:peptide-methionine (S)-S-oxide reductase MsrA [Fulvimarina sp. 2208YS6-2-32]|uniref:Peptide methionine sulfoxide reductase MsrA n=1 Tax=Fulvimarina uroteuthidis TaxID=3098149 RepID=A0ABU5HWZ7_9HYPH|nr:peptide-methionine (S)-S-oxide reductase MsrA [Fulvimarina sp. 2208YS6-2-32]MDY8107659.1 peptide-methionine (S)-S-oxide reductase MsrA [Fulvimarina sp. 2208YS6-2-32]
MTQRFASILSAAASAACLLFITPAQAQQTETAIFAGGCFWCVESDFDHVDGVLDTTSGYIGGKSENPTYQDHSGHVEAVRITYDPSKVTYDTLLDVYWHSIDPTDGGGQFCDRGYSYTSAIFAVNADQLAKANATKAEVQQQLGTVATEIRKAPKFWDAEGYHQDYYLKNPVKYKFYRSGCGRNDTVERVWGDKAFQGIKGAVS